MPILRSRHSSASEPPVVSAIFGMCPSALLRGSRVRSAFVIGLSTQGLTVARVISRRHLPTWMTIGMFATTGTFCSTKRPFASVSAVAIGLPDSCALQRSHDAPSGIGSSGAFGT